MAVPNIVLIILLAVIPAIILFVNFLFIVVLQSPMDMFQSWIPKIAVLIGLSLAYCVVLCLPFDVWNVTQQGLLDEALPIIWQVLFALVAFFVLVVLPFCFVYYESYDSERPNNCAMQILYGIAAAAIITVIALVIVGISYIWLGYATIPVTYYTNPVPADTRMNATNLILQHGFGVSCDGCNYLYGEYEVRMSFIVYGITILSICGWIPFLICGGCGMSAFPLMCILKCCERPTPIDEAEFLNQQKIFADKAEKFIRIGVSLEQERKNKYQKIPRAKHARLRKQFKEGVMKLEANYNQLEKRMKFQYVDWIFYIVTFIIGIIGFILTTLWVVHIVIYSFPRYTARYSAPIWPFLNIFFMWLDYYVFPIFGLILYGIFAFYLMFAVVFGNIAIMSKLPLVSVYPLKYKDTMMTSLIFNAGLMLLVSLAVIQFVSDQFSAYARGTALGAMFNVYVFYTKYIGWFFSFVNYIFVVFIILGALASFINACIPTREQKELEAILNQTA